MVKTFTRILISTIVTFFVFLPNGTANNISPFETIFDTNFVIAGTGGMRGVGTGSFTVSGISGVVTKAYLYWHGPTNSSNLSANSTVTLNGKTVVGQNIGLSHDNCWGFQNSQAHRADVTAIVENKGNGTYTLSNFVKPDGIDINGVSLIVFFYDEDFTNHRDVTIFHGNDSNFSNPYDEPGWNVTLTRIQYVSGTANMYLIVSDGQNWLDDALIINGQVVIPSGQIFAGDLGPRLPGPSPPGTTGSLWDIKTINVTQFLSPGLNALSLTTGYNYDCLSIVVAVVDLPAGAAPFVVPELTKAPNVFDFTKTSDLFTLKTLDFISDYSNAFSTPSTIYLNDNLDSLDNFLIKAIGGPNWKERFSYLEGASRNIGTALSLTSILVSMIENPPAGFAKLALFEGKEILIRSLNWEDNSVARVIIDGLNLLVRTPDGAVSTVLTISGMVLSDLIAGKFGTLAKDPPDPDFTQVFQAYFTPGGPLTLAGISPELNKLLGQELDSLYKTSSYLLGLTTTINRYGAALEAEDSLSAGLQFEAFLKYLSLYDTSIIETANYLNKLRQAMLELGIPDGIYDRQSIITMQNQLRMNGLPIEVREFFKNLGLSPEDIDELVSRMLEYVPPDSVKGSLYSTLSDTAATLLSASSFSYIDTVQAVYTGYYQRPADPGGLLYWVERLDRTNGNLNEIIEAFANSAESQALYGTINSSNISNVVDSIYMALFNRPAEAEGKAYYVNGFNSGQFTAATIMLNVLYGAQNEDLLSVNNKVTAANLFTRTIDPELDGANFQVTYEGDSDVIAGRNFLNFVTWDSATVPTQDETTAYIKTNIANPGDPILNP